MNPKRKKHHPSMGGAATYRIHVLGHLAESWSNCIAGMKIMERRGTGGAIETILEGELADQAALSGVLNTLPAAPSGDLRSVRGR